MSDQTEAEFLATYDPTAYPPTGITVDLVLLTIIDGNLSVLLVKRAGHPYKGKWAIPGGFVEHDEGLDDAALRELQEETGTELFSGHIEQLGAYGKPSRDPRFRIVSIAYVAFFPEPGNPIAGSDAAEARYWPVDMIDRDMLAFDHGTIIDDAIERARAKLEYTTHATAFLPYEFTIGQLRRVYETVWGVDIEPANFRRKVLSTFRLEEAGGSLGLGRLYALPALTENLYPPFYRETTQ